MVEERAFASLSFLKLPGKNKMWRWRLRPDVKQK